MDFKENIDRLDASLLTLDELETLQVNLGNLCNLSCNHCHVQAGPNGQKIMVRSIMEKILKFLQNHGKLCLDLTGGCPEMNPDFSFFIENAFPLVSKMMARTNFTVFLELELGWIPKWYKEHKVVVIGSLPCYTEDNTDAQRGRDVFKKSIQAIKLFNDLGYGKDDSLELNLVYNPCGDFLPGPQHQLEMDYKKHLYDEFGLYFTRLFTITNAPIGRFKSWLKANGSLEKYRQMLVDSFNPNVVNEIMCRSLVSVDYRGMIYNCDFNQALGLPLINSKGQIITIDTLEKALAGEIRIITGPHCFCCTAGAGSSCTGTLIK